MERKINFSVDEYYHVFSRGVEKRKIFLNSRDYSRFLSLLYIMNQKASFHMGNFLSRGKKSVDDVFQTERDNVLVSILCYSLMPNHFHLLLLETQKGGISKFMGKLLTAYSMYFNTKYERSGPLFVHPFRSVHVADDSYLRHLFGYIHLNALDLIEPDWEEKGIKNFNRAIKFVENYNLSSYPDFLGVARPLSKILNKSSLPTFVTRATLGIEEFDRWYREYDFE